MGATSFKVTETDVRHLKLARPTGNPKGRRRNIGWTSTLGQRHNWPGSTERLRRYFPKLGRDGRAACFCDAVGLAALQGKELEHREATSKQSGFFTVYFTAFLWL